MTPIKLDSSIVGDREKILLYGLGGAGKTFTALTAPGPIYCIVFGGPNELKTGMSKDFKDKYPKQEIYYDFAVEPLGERGHFKEASAYDHACDLLDDALEQEEKGDFTFKTLVIDSASGLRSYAMNKAMEVNFHRASSGTQKTALARLRQENIIIPGDNDYMSEMSLTTQFMDWVFRLDKHLVVVTHEWQQKKFDRATRETTVSWRCPLFTGKNRESIPNLFDNVWHVEPIQKGRGIVAQLETVGSADTYGKTRMGGVLAPVIRDPNLADIITKMQESVKEKAKKSK